MNETEKKVLKAFYDAHLKGNGAMGRVTSKKLGISKEEFRAIIEKFKDNGYLPGAFSVRGGKNNSAGWIDQGNELSDEAIEIAKML